jgi:uncharacterized protein
MLAKSTSAASAIALVAVAVAVAAGQSGSGRFTFTPLAASAVCTPGGNAAAPFEIPAGYSQRIIASEPQFSDVPDMQTQNEDGPEAGRVPLPHP